MNTFLQTLHADGPAGPHVDKLMLFGRFVGSWTIDWSDGGPVHASGELHFGWVLGGRAVQDIWIVDAPRPFHGSTIRFYDPAIDAWRSTWIEPINARVRRFIGRPVGEEIVLLSDEEAPQLRWRFTDVRPDSFTWRGEISHDGGATWAFEEQMVAKRTS